MSNSQEIKFHVVRNEELQLSIWRSDRPIPKGWEALEFYGTRDSCLEYISEIWKDMRPLRLQKQISSLKL